MGHRLAVLLALLPALAFGAVQGPPAYVYTGAAPSGACVGTRVWIDALGSGTYYCNAGTWALASAGGGSPGGVNLNIQVNNGSGGFAAYGGFTCSNSFPRALTANGGPTCAAIDLSADTAATALPATKGGTGLSTTTAGAVIVGGATNTITQTTTGTTSQVLHGNGSGVPFFDKVFDADLNGAYSGVGACGANTWASTLTRGSAPTCTQPAFSNLSGSATAAQLPAASTTLGGVKMASACGAGNHVSSIGAGGELTCSADAGGGGGSPGGSTTQVQYNNAGAFGGLARVTTDGNDLIFTGTSTPPSAPAAGSLKVWAARPHGASGPALPYWMGGSTQVDYRLFPEVLSSDPVWGCLQPAAHGSTTITPVGSMQAGGATGTPAAVAWAATDERTRAKWVQYPTTAAINLNAGLRAGVDYVWRGNAAGLGGFYWWGSMNIVTANAGQRVFMGLKDATAVLTAASDPNAALDSVYFGCNAADTNLSICSNDNAGTATCTTLGANFPCKTANTSYDVALWAAPNGSSIGYYIRRLVNGSEATGTVSTDLPRNTVQLGWDFTINSGSTAAIATMQFGGTCQIANP